MATERLTISSTGPVTSDPLRHLGIDWVAQSISQEVGGEDGRRKENGGIDDVVREQAEHLPALGHDVTPGRHLRRHADAEERQDSLDENCGSADESALYDHGSDRVGQ